MKLSLRGIQSDRFSRYTFRIKLALCLLPSTVNCVFVVHPSYVWDSALLRHQTSCSSSLCRSLRLYIRTSFKLGTVSYTLPIMNTGMGYNNLPWAIVLTVANDWHMICMSLMETFACLFVCLFACSFVSLSFSLIDLRHRFARKLYDLNWSKAGYLWRLTKTTDRHLQCTQASAGRYVIFLLLFLCAIFDIIIGLLLVCLNDAKFGKN